MNSLKREIGPMTPERSARAFPADAYDYNDDVSAEAVADMRERARKFVENEKWEQVDGFGLVVPA
ncbi:hypothetical protein [Aurantimonas coralicida]|uniref:hypothetical protein n=1 Tax=Aurantimonas coralicida TaxID=182270 RepID=UPI0023F0AC1B|nr:hypothetical protein [Aurantimonas coralicida]